MAKAKKEIEIEENIKTETPSPMQNKKMQKKQQKNSKNNEKVEQKTTEIKTENKIKEKKPKKAKEKKAKEKKVKQKKQAPLYFEKIEQVTPILRDTPTDTSQTMYFDKKSGKPLYGPTPLYIDKITGKPVFATTQQDVKVVEKTIQLTNRNQKNSFSLASTALFIAGLLFFSICYFVVSLSANTEYGIFWGITILSWLFGPIMIMIVPPLCYLAGIVFMFIGFFKSPHRVYTWVCIPINLALLAGGIYLLVTYLPNFL